MDSPILVIPKTEVNAKKDFTDVEKHLEFLLKVEMPELKQVC